MENNKLKNIVAFCVLMENGEGVEDKSPGYILEKLDRYIGKETDEWRFGLDFVDTAKLKKYIKKWKI